MAKRKMEFDANTERKKRDMILDRIAKCRSHLVTEALKIAHQIVKRKGIVTSPEVLRIMRKRKVRGIKSADPRFMGAVFREGWIRIKFVNGGSHMRPVSVWRSAKHEEEE